MTSEYQEQCTVIEWAKLYEKKFPALEWLHTSHNGVRVSTGVAVKMKKSGNKKGVLDLFLPALNYPFSGLYIKMKKENGSLSKEQRRFKSFVEKNGFKAVACYSANEAIAVLTKYCEEILENEN